VNKKTKKALNESIAHWERMRAFETTEEFDKEEPHGPFCSLCKLFLVKYNCEGCPVFEKTGKVACRSTPYSTAYTSYFEWKRINTKKNRTAWRKAATREINFLKSLG